MSYSSALGCQKLRIANRCERSLLAFLHRVSPSPSSPLALSCRLISNKNNTYHNAKIANEPLYADQRKGLWRTSFDAMVLPGLSSTPMSLPEHCFGWSAATAEHIVLESSPSWHQLQTFTLTASTLSERETCGWKGVISLGSYSTLARASQLPLV